MDPPDRKGTLMLKNKASHSIPFTQSFMQGNYTQGQWVGRKAGRGMQGTTQLFSTLFSTLSLQLSGP